MAQSTESCVNPNSSGPWNAVPDGVRFCLNERAEVDHVMN